jgi:hypothetical protein|tara:strand:+ start:3310 stop:3411 length:102 start_codon:yes stop_codon:yes gene_type:complete
MTYGTGKAKGLKEDMGKKGKGSKTSCGKYASKK